VKSFELLLVACLKATIAFQLQGFGFDVYALLFLFFQEDWQLRRGVCCYVEFSCSVDAFLDRFRCMTAY
jgi:hypothetical protein